MLYSPLNSGLRFSKNAVNPSTASFELETTRRPVDGNGGDVIGFFKHQVFVSHKPFPSFWVFRKNARHSSPRRLRGENRTDMICLLTFFIESRQPDHDKPA